MDQEIWRRDELTNLDDGSAREGPAQAREPGEVAVEGDELGAVLDGDGRETLHQCIIDPPGPGSPSWPDPSFVTLP